VPTDCVPIPIQALKRQGRLSQRVSKQLEDLIVNGVLKTGQRLPPERELAELFGVSRTVIREAVQDLTAKGLLESQLGNGTRVRGPSPDSVLESLRLLFRVGAEGFAIENLNEVRRVLEVSVAARAAARVTDEDIADLEDVYRHMEEAQTDPEAAAKLDVEFHRALAVAAHNALFIILLDALNDWLLEVRRIAFRDPDNLPKALYHHHKVLEAVRKRDPRQAEATMSAHLDEAEDTLGTALKARNDLGPLFGNLDKAESPRRGPAPFRQSLLP